MWYDYDLQNDKSRKYFFPSNLFPLWADCYDPSKRDEMANSAIKYLRKTGAIRCKGGVPTSMNDSGQQWDFPNAWPPLQHILVAGKILKDSHLNNYFKIDDCLSIIFLYVCGFIYASEN